MAGAGAGSLPGHGRPDGSAGSAASPNGADAEYCACDGSRTRLPRSNGLAAEYGVVIRYTGRDDALVRTPASYELDVAATENLRSPAG